MNKYSYRVYYEDTDAGGVVYYANYLKFFERARTDFLRDLGISQNELLTQEKIAFVVRKCDLHYIRPAKLDDLIEIEIEITDISEKTIDFAQRMLLDGSLLNKMNVQVVCINSNNLTSTLIPNNIIEKIT
ncbi:MAG: tol-pal system-associated acyl-CoA thioesterase [Rickettsiales bacterium]|nr:tol-pal system-associated acyl-CoA thioesterase [Rickettsiales bacterium]